MALHIGKYNSPIGTITIAADDEAIVGLWFEQQRFYADCIKESLTTAKEEETKCITATRRWLDLYFRGTSPNFTPPIHFIGTLFRKTVWQLLLQIPYGTVTTYADLARKIAASQGKSTMSAQAVGGAVSHNPISIIVPCHRVIGSDGNLTGYAGGLDRKQFLLQTEAGNQP